MDALESATATVMSAAATALPAAVSVTNTKITPVKTAGLGLAPLRLRPAALASYVALGHDVVQASPFRPVTPTATLGQQPKPALRVWVAKTATATSVFSTASVVAEILHKPVPTTQALAITCGPPSTIVLPVVTPKAAPHTVTALTTPSTSPTTPVVRRYVTSTAVSLTSKPVRTTAPGLTPSVRVNAPTATTAARAVWPSVMLVLLAMESDALPVETLKPATVPTPSLPTPGRQPLVATDVMATSATLAPLEPNNVLVATLNSVRFLEGFTSGSPAALAPTVATTATAISVFLVVVAVVPQATQNSVRQQALDTNGVSPKPVTVPTDATMVTATNVLPEAVAAQVQLNKFAN